MNYSYHSYSGYEEMFCECEINDKRVPYDACDDGDLNEAIESYKAAFKYIGSGYITYHDGTKNTWKKLNHFFIKHYETTSFHEFQKIRDHCTSK